MDTFVRWSPSHLVAIVLTITIPLFLAWWSRRGTDHIRGQIVGTGFSVMLIGVILTNFFLVEQGSSPRWQDQVPLHLCDLALFACAIGCISKKQYIFEIAYFWGLAGTTHGLFTPDLAYAFPAIQFWLFFLGHGGIVGAVLFMVAGLGLRPQWRSVFRAYAAILIYGGIAALFNLLFDTNYGFLCQKPVSGSLFDLLGPWPWYIVFAGILGFISFWVLYAPWWFVPTRKPKT